MQNDPATPPNSDQSVDWEALARHLAGESSPAESERIAQWLAEHKADAELLAALDNAMEGLALHDTTDVDVEGALSRVAAQRDALEHRRDVRPRRTPRDRRISRAVPSAWRGIAMLVAAAAIVLAARLLLPTDNHGHLSTYTSTGDGARA